MGADDRTGALEVAAEIARVAGPVGVTVRRPPEGDGVVDLASRHLSPKRAATAAAKVPAAHWNAHKIDSMLRGNWAHELRARHEATGRRVLLMPAWPAMGRTCIRGEVYVGSDGVADVRGHLPEATLLADGAALERWLASDEPFAAVDIWTTEEMHDTARRVASHDVLIAGPAGPIGAVFAARHGTAVPPPSPLFHDPVLVVCGSATDVSREQVRRLQIARPDIDVLAAPPATGALSRDITLLLASLAQEQLDKVATLVVIGGDTAAAVLGDAPRLVFGTVAPGMPWSRDEEGGGVLVITKAGAFGRADVLVDLFSRETD
ncbi:MAG: 4-hydroxythreonine-4-phosphate dehydrogenase 2 [Actinomycetota bacterium]